MYQDIWLATLHVNQVTYFTADSKFLKYIFIYFDGPRSTHMPVAIDWMVTYKNE